MLYIAVAKQNSYAKHNMKKQISTSKARQTVFGITAATFVSGVIQMVLILTSLNAPADMAGWYIWFGVMQLMPLVIFGLYWLVTRGNVWERLFEASTLSIATVFVSSVVGTLFIQFLWPLIWTYFNASASLIVLNGIGLLFGAIIVAVLVWRMKRSASLTKKPQSFGRAVLVGATLAFFATNILQTATQVIAQYRDNQNLSAYVASFVGFGVMVMLTGAVVFAEKRRGAKRPFGSAVFITAIGVIAAYAVLSIGEIVSLPQLSQWALAAVITVGIGLGLAGFWSLYRTLRVLD